MKKRLIVIMVVLIICIYTAGCNTVEKQTDEQKNQKNFDLTVGEFTDTFAEKLGEFGTLIPISIIDDEETLSKIYTFVVQPSSQIFENTHMQLTENSSGYITDVTMFAEFGELLKADGSREKTSNIDFYLFVYAAANTLDDTIDIDILED